MGDHSLAVHGSGPRGAVTEMGATLSLKPLNGSVVQLDGSGGPKRPLRITGRLKQEPFSWTRRCETAGFHVFFLDFMMFYGLL